MSYYELKKLLDDFVWMRMLIAAGVPEGILEIDMPGSVALAKEQESVSRAKLNSGTTQALLLILYS